MKDTQILITKAGGRCSFQYGNFHCDKQLSNGRVNLGERAHIYGVNGPRANTNMDESKLNSYENLIWLCREHHKIIDTETSKYTPEVLFEMKRFHENYIETGRKNFNLPKHAEHDYSFLSNFFFFVDINLLYTDVVNSPFISSNFLFIDDVLTDLIDYNPHALPLKDPLLNQAFSIFIHSYYQFFELIHPAQLENNDAHDNNGIVILEFKFDNIPKMRMRLINYLKSIEALEDLIQKRFPQIMRQTTFLNSLED